ARVSEGADALGGRRVRVHGPVGGVRGLDQRLDLLLREGRLPAAARSPAVIRVDLDPVGAPSSLLALRADHFRDTARLLGALRRAAHIRPQAPGGRAVGAGGDDGASHDEETRTLEEAVLERAL